MRCRVVWYIPTVILIVTLFFKWRKHRFFTHDAGKLKNYRLSTTTYLWLYSPCGPWPLFQFLNLYAVGRTPWTSYQPVARPLPTRRTTQRQNRRTQTSMPRVGFEPTIPVFERAKTVHVLDRAATVIGFKKYYLCIYVALRPLLS
jgi:hypothetical protein